MSRIYIKIPKEFELHFARTRFKDSLHRLSSDAHLMAGRYEQETARMLAEAFKNAIVIPDHVRLINADDFAKELREDADISWNKNVAPTSWSDALTEIADMIDVWPAAIEADKEDGE